ncbi:MAG: c-type cytochrome [Candidatus Methylomirabilia bacterium]
MSAWMRVGIAAGLAVLLMATSSWAQNSPKGDLALGEAVYKEICFSCHGVKGDGKGPSWLNTKPRPQVFIDRNYMSRLTDQYLFEVVKYGKLAVLQRNVPDSSLEAVAMPSFEDVLEDSQIRELIAFERSAQRGAPEMSEETREIFTDACAVCHGAEGRGDGTRPSKVQPAPPGFVSEIQPAPADYHDPLFMARFADEFLVAVIKKGRIGATEELGFDTMKPYGHILSDEEIWGVIRYIRETFINSNTSNPSKP